VGLVMGDSFAGRSLEGIALMRPSAFNRKKSDGICERENNYVRWCVPNLKIAMSQKAKMYKPGALVLVS